MKATRKLIPAIAMLLISAVMMSTATFAWFSTNSTVKVNNFTLTAKANNTFLVIANAGDTGFSSENYQTTSVNYQKAEGENDVLIPVAFDTTTDKWYTGIGTAFDDGTLITGSKADVAEAELAGTYALKRQYSIRVANNFLDTTDLILSKVNVAAAGSEGATNYNEVVGVVASAVVNGVTVYNTYTYDVDNSKWVLDNEDVLAEDITSDPDDAILVTVYVFIDGNHPNVNTKEVVNLKNLSVSLEFSCGSQATNG